MALSPGQVRALQRADRVRGRWVVRAVALYSLIGWLVVIIALARLGISAPVVASGIAIGVIGAALFASFLTPSAWVGAIVVVANTAVVTALTHVFGTDASIELQLFPIGFSTFLLVPPEYIRVRAALATMTALVFGALQFVAPPIAERAPFDADQLERTSRVSNLLAAATVLVLAWLVQRRFMTARRIFEGAALYGELRAATDELTGLVNRRPVQARLEELERTGRTDYAIAVLDLDNFKDVNDAYGHECGDRAIQTVAGVLSDCFRDVDLVSRWGGDEFVVVLYRVLPSELASTLERVRVAVENTWYTWDGKDRTVTVSIGGAIARTGRTPMDCLAAADDALYRAKEAGRNRVILADRFGPATESRRMPSTSD
ncbi:diguanylate cyclase [Demequina sp. NBRC 110052]|uniref:GGDEF domain-containing protein n=1 Tax=Demequina sp. NBRC 110052 TaxID=1570341 RepID=UPI0013564F65|nr:GGDEF domain-containing protein [Demequina sp. NBRC 110052]